MLNIPALVQVMIQNPYTVGLLHELFHNQVLDADIKSKLKNTLKEHLKFSSDVNIFNAIAQQEQLDAVKDTLGNLEGRVERIEDKLDEALALLKSLLNNQNASSIMEVEPSGFVKEEDSDTE